MAKKGPPIRKKIPNFSKLSLQEASLTPEDTRRFAIAFEKLFFSYELIPDKRNLPQVKQALARNKTIQREAYRLEPSARNQSLESLMNNGYRILFLVDDKGIDHGYTIIKYDSPTTAYIDEFTVFNQLIGMGKHFYQLLEKHLKSKGITAISLDAPFYGSKAFWEKMKFEYCGTTINQWRYKKKL